MPKKSSGKQSKPRIPIEINGIQVNFCKNPTCNNFGVPASQKPQRGKVRAQDKDQYRLTGGKSSLIALKCCLCGEYPPLKSNLAVHEELERMVSDITPLPKPSCPNQNCENHTIPITEGNNNYQSFGKSHSGSKRYRCKSCHKTFTVGKPTIRQRQSHKNKMIFSLLMNKSPFRRICEVAEINPETLYQRIDFFYKQCRAFSAHREQKLLKGKKLGKLYLSTDRQDYIVNWSSQDDKRNVTLHAVGSADNITGYVFGMHLDFDPLLDRNAIEEDALITNDYSERLPYRKYARLWLKEDYYDALRQRKSASNTKIGDLNSKIVNSYNDSASRVDVEVPSTQDIDSKLPSKGMQIHSEYTLYAHFFYLSKLLGGAKKLRFFLDQDSGIRAACLAPFYKDVIKRRVDAFYVRINKDLTINEKRQALSESRAVFDKVRTTNPGITDKEIELLMIKSSLKNMSSIGHWKDKWLTHPFPSMSEPEKAVCFLTDLGDYSEDHLVRLHLKASLHAIDRYFMQIRRRLSLLERPLSTSSGARRTWHGYSAYNPEIIVKLLMIFRIFYNYILIGKDKKTPAMRLGLAKAKLDIEDIIYFKQS